MSLKEELILQTNKIFSERWTRRDAAKIPEPEDLKLGNDGADIEAAVLYADLAGSTHLVDNWSDFFAAEIYKSYLTCAARIIKSEGAKITSYDGDRIMAVFAGDHKRTLAVRAALKINYVVEHILNPAMKRQYNLPDLVIRHVVGVDCSKLMAARIGVRNDNDLVWVGRAANHAAKLTTINDQDSIFVTQEVYDKMNDSSKFGGASSALMWRQRTWTDMGNALIYSSNWTWEP